MNVIRMALVAVFLTCLPALADDPTPVKAAKADKCPVCGMFVAKYPDFLSQVIFRDGSYALFDGAKDMFKYYFNIKKYNPSKKLSDIAAIYVTDYYSMNPTDGRKAFYVIGSNVFGPMGKELIPFEKEPEAKEFLVDHAGKKLIRFDGITPEIINGLD
ncbi:MAG: nitrous oxide reductase accessory protein NosL, partial [Desulfatirhabdiaceae bacterium]|nr:nitrous oxide reductase accessory protein NosL [Desulfatirhabdiaceae bacterium]